MNILIVAVNFPPLNKIGSRRIFSFAEYLSAAGHRVTVITSKKTRIDGALNYQPRSSHLYELIEVEWTRGARNNDAPVAVVPRASLKSTVDANLRKFNRWLRWNILGALFHPYDIWYYKALRDERVIAKAADADIIVSSYGPAAPFYLASALKKRYPNLVWIADYRDLWSNIPTEHLLWPFRSIQRQLEQRIISRANGLTCVSRGMATHLRELHGPKVPCMVIYNGFEGELADQSDAPKVPTGAKTIRHIGTIYPGLRNPKPLFEALEEIHSTWKIEFIGPNTELLVGSLPTSPLRDRIELQSPVPPDQALRLMETADVLLLLESTVGQSAGTLTAKVFEYMQTGRPILAIGITPDSELGTVLEKYGAGYVVEDDVNQIIENLKMIESQPKKSDAVYVSTFSRSNQAKQLLEYMYELRAKKSN